MTDGTLELLEVVASWALALPATHVVLVQGDRRLDRSRAAHGWPASSRQAAVLGTFLVGVLYGAAALLLYFLRSRSGARGLALGLLWAALLMAANVALLWAIESLAAAAGAMIWSAPCSFTGGSYSA